MRKFFECTKGNLKYIILTPLFVALEVVLDVLVPFLMSKVIDVGLKFNDIFYILKIGGIMSVMAAAALICGVMSGRFAAKAATGFSMNLRNRLFNDVQKFSFSNLDKFGTPSLITRLTTDVTNVQNAFMMALRIFVRAPLMIAGATIMAVTMNPELSVIFAVAIPFVAVVLAVLLLITYPLFVKMLDRYDEMNESVQENLAGIRVVKTFVRKDYENDKFVGRSEMLRRASVKAERLMFLDMPFMQFAMFACMLAVVILGGIQIVNGTMEFGELSTFLVYVMQILMSLMLLSFVFIIVALSRASAKRISEVFREQSDITDAGNPADLKVMDGSIEFKNVSFSYFKSADNLVLKNINLTVNSGETVGIIGGTGSSKTTLVQLIPRLYDAFAGEVLVSGRNVKEYMLEELRSAVAVVLQKNVLFSGSIKENLRWGNADATDEQIEQACKIAEAHDFITSFEQGYDTKLGQGGVNVSGGQKQRLCIARALLKNPKVLILDDSTSAVDTATDSKIRKALSEQLNGMTKIIIAQRISSVSDADKIIVMDGGEILAVGKHDELLQTSAIYREVFESQQKGAQNER